MAGPYLSSSKLVKVCCDICIARLRYSLDDFCYRLLKSESALSFFFKFREKAMVERSCQPQWFQTWPQLHYNEAKLSLSLKHIFLGIEMRPCFCELSYLGVIPVSGLATVTY